MNSVCAFDRKKFSRYPVREYDYVKVYCLYDYRMSKSARDRYLLRPIPDRINESEFGFPVNAKYEVSIDLKNPFIGELVSPLEYGIFLFYGCKSCGYKFLDAEGNRIFYSFGSPCPRCKGKIESMCDGSPHKHREYYVFQLHIKDLKVRDALGEFLGAERDRLLGFSCKGSWHNFRNDTSGFDVCHLNCLDELIDVRIKKGLTGVDLFKFNYPELGVVYTGAYDPLTGWKDGKQLSSEDFAEIKTEYGKRKDRGLNPQFYRVMDELA